MGLIQCLVVGQRLARLFQMRKRLAKLTVKAMLKLRRMAMQRCLVRLMLMVLLLRLRLFLRLRSSMIQSLGIQL